MLDILKTYYNFEIVDYYEYNEGIVFYYNDLKYYFAKIGLKIDLKECYELSLYLKSDNIKVHDFIFNKYGELLSNDYVLFKVNELSDEIDINDIYLLNKLDVGDKYNYVSMEEFWCNKIDYIEMQVYELSNIKNINYSIDYFVGISELLLSFLKENYVCNRISFVHRSNDILNPLDFYNPLNIIVGDSYKDVVSYIRLKDDWDLLYSLVDKCTLFDEIYVFVRMCFPFYYFDLVSNIIIDGKDEEKLLVYLNDIRGYEEYLYNIERIFGIKLFYWIKKEY